MTTEISIIVPCYNKEKYISETIDSVIQQTFVNWELIMIDDVSTDQTNNIVQSYCQKESRIVFLTNSENRGANYSRNKGIQQAKGKYIIFLDADDVLTNNCLEKRFAQIHHTNLDFCVFSMGTFYNQIGDSKSVWSPRSKSPLIDFLQHKLPWSILQPVWRKTFLLNLKGFDENFKRLQDVELHTRALMLLDAKYKLIMTESDCYYRIDEERKNYTTFSFLERQIESSILYYIKFSKEIVKTNLKSYLFGSIYQTYLLLLFQLKCQKINKEEFFILEKKLLHNFIGKKRLLILFKISSFFNLLPIHIKGVNWLINKFITKLQYK